MIVLRENEKVRMVKRRHRFVLFRELFLIALSALAVLVMMIIIFFASFDLPEFIADSMPFLLGIASRFFFLFILSVILLILWQVSFIILANYYLDCWIVTNQRTIHTELKNLFNRVLSTVPHSKIQDVTVTVKGIIPTIFKYGDLQIQTAGKFHEFIFKDISEPYKTKEAIYREQKEYFKRMRGYDREYRH